jgi:hypothetical protein
LILAKISAGNLWVTEYVITYAGTPFRPSASWSSRMGRSFTKFNISLSRSRPQQIDDDGLNRRLDPTRTKDLNAGYLASTTCAGKHCTKLSMCRELALTTCSEREPQPASIPSCESAETTVVVADSFQFGNGFLVESRKAPIKSRIFVRRS